MKALVLTQEKSLPELIDYETPSPKAGEVLIDIKAASFNRRDYWITKGLYPGIQVNTILGSDGAGLMNGHKVLVNPSLNWGPDPACQAKDYVILGMPVNGTFAEKMVIAEDRVHPMPEHLSFEQAAALPLGGLTAYRVLFSRCQVKPTDKVLITGVGGGVAVLAMQFSLAIGAEVYVTSGSPAKIEKALQLGAKGGANYKDEDWGKQLKQQAGGFDVIIDSAGGAGFPQLLKLCNPGARVGIYGGTTGNIPKISPQLIFWKQVSILGSTMGNDDEFPKMLKLVADHKIVPVIDQIFPFSEANKAFDLLEQSQQFGKVVLKIA